MPIVCGGQNGNTYYDSCFTYNTATRRWTETGWMTAGGKRHASASVHPELGLIITGGVINPKSQKILATVEATRDGKNFDRSIPDMPIPNHAHCQVTVDRNTIMTFGGCIAGNCHAPNVYKLDTRTKKWTKLPSMPTGRHSPVCGVVREKGVPKKVVVAGGWRGNYINSVEIFDLATLTWSKGI